MTARAIPGVGRGQRGFTLLELVVSMTVMSLVGLGIFGVLALGARSAGSGERITEQARRYRIANEVLSRQLAAAEPIQLPPRDDGGLGDQADPEPFFFGEAETLEYVTASPQRPDAGGMAIVQYWLEDGALRMSERPVFTAYESGGRMRQAVRDGTVSTVLLYDVASVEFAYLREGDSDQWFDTWDAADEDVLPAVVRVDVRPSAVGGPDFYHEVPLMVGMFNQIGDVDEDFRRRRVRRSGAEAGRARARDRGGDDGDDDDDDDDADDDDDE